MLEVENKSAAADQPISEDISDLWDGLNLGSLLNDLQRENDALVKAKKMKDPFYQHNKVVESAAYGVIMQRYNCQPAKPKVLAKKTLERLADPLKGRHESSVSKNVHKRVDKPPVRRVKTKQPKFQRKVERMHSPIRQKSSPDDRVSPITSPRKNSTKSTNPQDCEEEPDSFFLTGLGQENDKRPYMDVRINVQSPIRSPKRGTTEAYSPTCMYSARTREHLRQALEKEDMTDHQEELIRNALPLSPPKPTKKFSEQCAERRAEGRVKKVASKTATGKPARKKKTKKSDTDTSMRSSKAKSKAITKTSRMKKKTSTTVTGVSGSNTRGALVPVRRTGIGAEGLKPARKVTRDRLSGLQRVDRTVSDVTSSVGNNSDRDSKLLRSASGIGPRGRLKPANLLGSKSAPSIGQSSRRSKQLVQVEENREDALPYRLQPLAGTQRLLGRGVGSTMTGKYYSGRLQRAGVRLKPVIPTGTAATEGGAKVEKDWGAQRIRGGASTTSCQSSQQGSIRTRVSQPASSMQSHKNAKKPAELDPNDDHMAALFAAHAKKLSSNLEKATSLSSQYKRLKEFDGLTAANRNFDTCDPKPIVQSTQKESHAGENNEKSSPKKLSIVI